MNQVGNLLLLPGDGIGPEVMGEVQRVVGWFRDRQGLGFEYGLMPANVSDSVRAMVTAGLANDVEDVNQ